MSIEQEQAYFEGWWDGLPESMKSLLTYEVAKQAYELGRSALQAQDRECGIDMEIVAEQLRDMSSSAYETAMAFGISQDSFERLAHQVFDHARRVEENK